MDTGQIVGLVMSSIGSSGTKTRTDGRLHVGGAESAVFTEKGWQLQICGYKSKVSGRILVILELKPGSSIFWVD